MSVNILLWILGIVGTLILIGLSINAFFFKEILANLSEVKINVARLIENSANKERRITEIENEIKEIKRDCLKCKTRGK